MRRVQTMRALSKAVRAKVPAPFNKAVWPILQLFVAAMGKALEDGQSVRLVGIGTLQWHEVWSPDGPRMKLKFEPGYKYRRGRKDMEKYGVQFDDEKEKEASRDKQGKPGKCPVCGKELDSGGACPEHGTEPLEKKP